MTVSEKNVFKSNDKILKLRSWAAIATKFALAYRTLFTQENCFLKKLFKPSFNVVIFVIHFSSASIAKKQIKQFVGDLIKLSQVNRQGSYLYSTSCYPYYSKNGYSIFLYSDTWIKISLLTFWNNKSLRYHFFKVNIT